MFKFITITIIVLIAIAAVSDTFSKIAGGFAGATSSISNSIAQPSGNAIDASFDSVIADIEGGIQG